MTDFYPLQKEKKAEHFLHLFFRKDFNFTIKLEKSLYKQQEKE